MHYKGFLSCAITWLRNYELTRKCNSYNYISIILKLILLFRFVFWFLFCFFKNSIRRNSHFESIINSSIAPVEFISSIYFSSLFICIVVFFLFAFTFPSLFSFFSFSCFLFIFLCFLRFRFCFRFRYSSVSVSVSVSVSFSFSFPSQYLFNIL